ncbi:MAG: hypothetical protein M3N49_10730 [Candidatus Eremiobacteraeota bacterium]|nr:hypothetical protein [Candidatus Eremiobacteraeota bacterium]
MFENARQFRGPKGVDPAGDEWEPRAQFALADPEGACQRRSDDTPRLLVGRCAAFFGDDVQLPSLPRLGRGDTRKFSARRSRQRTTRHHRDDVDRYAMGLVDCQPSLCERERGRFRGGQLRRRASYGLDQDDGAWRIRRRLERSRPAEASVDRKHDVFHILRIDVLSVDDDEIFAAPRDEQCAGGIDEAEIAGSQVRPRFIGQAPAERLGGGGCIAPVSACRAVGANPDLADGIGADRPYLLGIDDPDGILRRGRTATDEPYPVGLGNDAPAMERISIDAADHGRVVRRISGDDQCGFRETVHGTESRRAKAVLAKPLCKSLERGSPHGFGPVEGHRPAREVHAGEFVCRDTVDARIENEIRPAARRDPVA